MNSSELYTITGFNNIDKSQIQLDSVSQTSPFLFSLLQQSSSAKQSGEKSSSLSRRSHYENTAMINQNDNLEISTTSDTIGQRKHNRESSYSKKETDNAVTRMLNKKENELKNQVQILVSCINKAQEQCLQLEKQADNIRFTEETNSKCYLKENEKRTIKLAELNQQIEFAANKLQFEMSLYEQLQQQVILLSENDKQLELNENNCQDQSDMGENGSDQPEHEKEEENDGYYVKKQLSSIIEVNTTKSNIDRLKDLMIKSQMNIKNYQQIIANFQMQQQGISANSMEDAEIYQSVEMNLQKSLKQINSQLKVANTNKTQLETALVTLLQAHQFNENIVFKAFNIDYESKLQLQKDNSSSEYLECCNSSVISTIRDINLKNQSILQKQEKHEKQQKQKSSEKISNQQMNPKYGRIIIDIKSIQAVEPSTQQLSSSVASKQQNKEIFYEENNNFDKENIPSQPNIQVYNNSSQHYTHNVITSKPIQSDNNPNSTQLPSNIILEKLKQTPNNKSFSSTNTHHKNNTNSINYSSQSNAKYNSNSISGINQPESSLNCSNINNNISHVSFFSPSQEKITKMFFSPSKKEFSSIKTTNHKKQLSNSSLNRINRIAGGTKGNLSSAEQCGNNKSDNKLSSLDFSFIRNNKGFKRSRSSSSNLLNQNRKIHELTEQSMIYGTNQSSSQQQQVNLKIQNLGNIINFPPPMKNNASLNSLQLSGKSNNPTSSHSSRRVNSIYSASSQTSSSFQKFQTLNERFTCNTFREYQNEESIPQVFKQTSHFKQGNYQGEDCNLKGIEGQDNNQKHTFTLNSQQNQIDNGCVINSSAYYQDHYNLENKYNQFQLSNITTINQQTPLNLQPVLQPDLTPFNPQNNTYLNNFNSSDVSQNKIDTSGLNLFTNRQNINSITQLNKTGQKQFNNQKLFSQFSDSPNVNSRCFEIYKMLGSARENITKKQAYDPRLHLGKPTSFGYTKRIIKFNSQNNTLEFIREENSFNSSKRTVEQSFQKSLVKEITLPSITESILNLKYRYSNQSVDMENQGIPQRLIDQKYLPFQIEIYRFGRIECVASSESDLKGILEAMDNLCQRKVMDIKYQE